MRVQMVRTAAGPGGVYRSGEIWELAADFAAALVAAGAAVALTGLPETPPVEQPQSARRLAVTTPPETRHGKRR